MIAQGDMMGSFRRASLPIACALALIVLIAAGWKITRASPAPFETRRVRQIDFGRAVAGSEQSHILLIRNLDSKPRRITSIATSCGCTVAGDVRGKSIEPGQGIQVPVKVTLGGEHELFSTEVAATLEGGQVERLLISGTILLPLPPRLNLGSVRQGEVIERSFVYKKVIPSQSRLRSVGFPKETISRVEVIDTNKSGDETIRVTFRKDIGYGPFKGMITINTDDDDVPLRTLPFEGKVLERVEVDGAPLTFSLTEATPPSPQSLRVFSPYGQRFVLRRIAVRDGPSILSFTSRDGAEGTEVTLAISIANTLPKRIIRGTVELLIEMQGEMIVKTVPFYAIQGK